MSLGYDPETGKAKRKSLYGDTQAEVLEKKNALMAQLQRQNPTRPMPDHTVSSFLQDWLTYIKKITVSPRSLDWYTTLIETHIIPALGSVPLSRLTTGEAQALFNHMIEQEGLSLRTVKAVRDILNQALKYAVETRLLTENPIAYSRIPKSDRRVGADEKEPLSPELRKKVLEAAKNDDIVYPIILTLMFTGMRAGEMLALVWKNVDMKNRIITVDRAITLDTKFDETGKKISRTTIVAMPKTHSGIRKISVPGLVIDALQGWHKKLMTLHPDWLGPDMPVFISRKGTQRTYNGFRTSYRHFLERNGLGEENLNLHRYRHNYATMMLEKGVSPRVVQKMLGHHDIETTLGTYSHASAELFKDAADILSNVFDETMKQADEPKEAEME